MSALHYSLTLGPMQVADVPGQEKELAEIVRYAEHQHLSKSELML